VWIAAAPILMVLWGSVPTLLLTVSLRRLSTARPYWDEVDLHKVSAEQTQRTALPTSFPLVDPIQSDIFVLQTQANQCHEDIELVSP
jgi:hypothetical protein